MKTIPCVVCAREIPKRWYHRFLAPRCGPEAAEVQRCAEIAAAADSEPPGPLWSEPAPDDLHVCPACEGNGVVIRHDYEAGPQKMTCPHCGGTGEVSPDWDEMGRNG